MAGTVIEGRIISVQEQRFRLQNPDGRVYLFTLGSGVAVDDAMLHRLWADGAHLTVTFTGEPNLAGCVAHKLLVGG